MNDNKIQPLVNTIVLVSACAAVGYVLGFGLAAIVALQFGVSF